MAAEAPGGTGATAHDISAKLFGAVVRPVPKTAQVTAAGVRILENSPRRVGWLIINRSAFDISVDYVQPIDSTAAILIAANGGTISSLVQEDGETTAWELFGLSPSGNAGIRVIEFITV